MAKLGTAWPEWLTDATYLKLRYAFYPRPPRTTFADLASCPPPVATLCTFHRPPRPPWSLTTPIS